MKEDKKEKAIKGIEDLLSYLGYDPKEERLEKTAKRFVTLLEDVVNQKEISLSSILKDTFPTDYRGLVCVKDIPFYSLCEHHLMPFFGKVHIVYAPREGRVIGLSKLTDLVVAASRKLQLQERMMKEIIEAIEEGAQADGVLLLVEGQHMCMVMQGYEHHQTKVNTLQYSGCFSEQGLRQEALLMVERGQNHDKGI